MSEGLFDIVFRGDIVAGHNIAEVKQRLMQMFKADEARINSLFTGAAVPLKRNLDKATAEKYRAVLVKAGAQIEVKPAGVAKTSRSPAPKQSPVPKQSSPAQSASEEAPKPVGLSLAPQSELPERAGDLDVPVVEVPDFGLAPAGGDLLQASERHHQPAVEVDISAITLRESEGDLLDESEKQQEQALDIELGHLDLAELGGDLLNDDEKRQEVFVELDLSAMALAPPGEDLGQIDKGAPPPPPDISGISLAD